ncbi:MAG: YlxR family protein [Streptosporangiales bacterium]|nr:YlxR family protein [Streptosporangiales bacterium]
MGCRVRVAKKDLLRVVAIEGSVVPDPHGRLPGRGAYLHPALVCLDLAVRRRAFPRALRAQGPLDVARVKAYVADTSVGMESEESHATGARGRVDHDRETRDGSMKR